MTPPNIVAKWSTWAPRLQSVLRIVAAFMFLLAGTINFAFPAGIPPDRDTVHLMSQMGLAGILETFGGGLLLLGLFTRPVAFLLAGEMAVALRSTASSGSTSRPPARDRGAWMPSGANLSFSRG